MSKDWTDKSYWAFSGLLVIVGGLQVGLMLRTLRAIKIQSDHMERQVTVMEQQRIQMENQSERLRESVQVAERASIAAQKSADSLVTIERSWLLFALDFPQDAIEVWVKNYGRAPARVMYFYKDWNVFAPSYKFPETPSYTGVDEQIEYVLAPQERKFIFRTTP